MTSAFKAGRGIVEKHSRFTSHGRAKLRVFRDGIKWKSTQPSPNLTQKHGTICCPRLGGMKIHISCCSLSSQFPLYPRPPIPNQSRTSLMESPSHRKCYDFFFVKMSCIFPTTVEGRVISCRILEKIFKVPLACLGSRAAAVQLWSSQKIIINTSSPSNSPVTLYLHSATQVQGDPSHWPKPPVDFKT